MFLSPLPHGGAGACYAGEADGPIQSPSPEYPSWSALAWLRSVDMKTPKWSDSPPVIPNFEFDMKVMSWPCVTSRPNFGQRKEKKRKEKKAPICGTHPRGKSAEASGSVM